jgi:hypothetical protein
VPERDGLNNCPTIPAIDYAIRYGLITKTWDGDHYRNTVAEVIPIYSYYDNGIYSPAQTNVGTLTFAPST